MIRSLWTAATGMVVQQKNLDVISNNIANVNTNGYKRSRADFQELMYQTTRMAGVRTEQGNQVPTGIQIGLGALLASVEKVFMQGDYQQTQGNLDLAIEGAGFSRSPCLRGTRRIRGPARLRRTLRAALSPLMATCSNLLLPSLRVPQPSQ